MSPRESEDCVPVSRIRRIALDPTAGSLEEAAHLRECPGCARFLAQARSVMPHPPRGDLLLWQAGRLDRREREEITAHLVVERCQRCLASFPGPS